MRGCPRTTCPWLGVKGSQVHILSARQRNRRSEAGRPDWGGPFSALLRPGQGVTSAVDVHRGQPWIEPPCRYRHAAGSSDVPALRIAQDEAADELLGRDPLALVVDMLLDQHMRR